MSNEETYNNSFSLILSSLKKRIALVVSFGGIEGLGGKIKV